MAMMKEKSSSSVSSLLMLPAALSTMSCLPSLPGNPFAFTMNDENCDTNNTTGNLIISADAANDDISLNKNHIMDIKQIEDGNSRTNHNRNSSKPHRKHHHNDLTLLRSDTNLTQITTLKPPPRPPPALVETSAAFASVSVIDTSEPWGMKPVIMVHTDQGRIGLIVCARTTEMKLQTQTTTSNRRKQQRAMIIEDIVHPTLVRDPRINIGDTLTAINDYTIDGTEHTADIAHMIVTMQRPLIIQVLVSSSSTTAVVERRPLFQELQQQHVTTLDNVFQNANTDIFHRRMKQRFGPQGQVNQFLQQEVEQQQTIESIPSLSSSLSRPLLPSQSLLLSASDKDYLNLLESLRTHPIANLHNTQHTQHATANHDSSLVTPYFEKSTEVVATLTSTAALAIEPKREHHKNPNGSSTHYDFGQSRPFIHPKSQPLVDSIKDGYNYQCAINKQQDDDNARKNNNNNNNNKINIPVDTVLPETASEMDITINLPSEPFILPSVEPACMSKTEVNSNDVLCGRILLGTAYRNEEGNCRCRALVQRLNPMYAQHNNNNNNNDNNNNNNNNTNAGRTLARSIVLIIRKRGGRFLEKRSRTSSGYFYEIGDAKAEKLISNLLLYRDVPSATRFLESTDESSITPETNNNGQHTGPVRPSLFIMADAAASAVLPPPAAAAAAAAAAATTTVGAATEDTQPEQRQHQGTRHLVPGEKDVVCGRGGVSNHHPGNKNYRALIQKHKAVYNRCFLKAGKQDVSISIVAKIREGGGRFLQPRKDETTTTWCEIGDHKAVEKTSQALWEKKSNTLQKRTKYGETAAIDFGQGMYEYYNLIF